MVHYSATNIDLVAAAISDPTRRAIIERLAQGPARISEIAEPISMSLTGFCKHVKVLERAGLVKRSRHGRDNTLELSPEPLRDVAQMDPQVRAILERASRSPRRILQET